MRILICDDDDLTIEQLKKLIKKFFYNISLTCPELICFSDGASLLADTGQKDILFLDIEMPGINGIYVGSELKKRNKNIIIFIVTSFSEYLDDAMRFHVFRYLSKPIDKQRFFRNMKEAIELYNSITCMVPIETKQGVLTLPASSIIAIEAREKKVIVYTISGQLNSINTIQYWAELLPQNRFFQTHRSFIVNFEYVTRFDHTLIHLYKNQIKAYLTRRNYTSFKKAYLLYLESVR